MVLAGDSGPQAALDMVRAEDHAAARSNGKAPCPNLS
jgi:hypothetical protein